MKIQEILEAKKLTKDMDDFDDVDEPAVDADQDKIPHIVMQLRKALDVDGDYPITFKDGKKFKLKLNDIMKFLKKYLSLKPMDRDTMQNMASVNIDGFHKALDTELAEPLVKHKIKGNRYMSSFAGDFDEK
jgi:hypothetical protein